MSDIARLTRRVSFSSGHRYWIADKSEDENRRLFGTWASPYNHGHNYQLYVTVEGAIDPRHGMVVNIKDIDDILQTSIVDRFDQKSINDEIRHFASRPPTLENLLQYIRHELHDLPKMVKLVALRLEETPLLAAEWHESAEAKNTMTLIRTYEFAASHRLHVPGLSEEENLKLFGKCNNPTGHGHNYILEVAVSGTPDPKTGMAIDLEAMDKVVEREIVDRYDHKNLSVDLPEFRDRNATSEVVAQEIFNRLEGKLSAKLERVRLQETARNIFEVSAS